MKRFCLFVLLISTAFGRQMIYVDQSVFYHQLDDNSADSIFNATYVASSPTEVAYFNGQALGFSNAAALVFTDVEMNNLIAAFYAMVESALWWRDYYAYTTTEIAYWNGIATGCYAAAQAGTNFEFDIRNPYSDDDP